MFEEVESNISQIISHCLYESIQNNDRKPAYISSDNIIQYFPDKLNIQRFDVNEKFEGIWSLFNDQIECKFGLKIITNNNNTKSWILKIINDHNSKNINSQNQNNHLFIQPLTIHNGFISKSMQFEWAKLEHINNDYKKSGIKCRFRAMNETHQFAVIPFVKCNKFNLNENRQNQNENENKPILCSGNDETNYDQWYAEQYLEFYGYYDREQEDDKNQSQNVLQSLSLNQNQEHQHYGAGQNGHYNNNDNHHKLQIDNDEDEEDIDLNYHQSQMNTSMNNRRERERKRLFRHFDTQNHDGFNQNNPNKKRKYNHCINSNQMSLYQS